MSVLRNIAPRLVTYRPPRIALMLIIVASGLQFFFGDSWQSSAPVAGTITLLVGFGLMMRAWWLFRVNDTAICPTAVSTSFITHDVYRATRNPMYLGMILMLAGIAMVFGSSWILLATVLYAAILDSVFCRYEEQKLLQQYGNRYATYLENVRRWL